MNRPWFSIIWFAIWGPFQAYAVGSVWAGSWQKPEAFPQEAYVSLIYPDMFFIPLYLLTVGLLLLRHWLGLVSGLVASGGVVYALIYLFALSELRGITNLVADGVFLICTLLAIWQLSERLRAKHKVNELRDVLGTRAV